jgi:phosphoadenosine phosphosulfate reductase
MPLFAALNEAKALLDWVGRTLGERAVLASSLGPQSLVVLELLHQLGHPISVLTLDTGFLFPETVALRLAVEARYGLSIRVVRPRHSPAEQAVQEGARLWENNPDRCCQLRKVVPLQEALAPYDAWVTGVRRDQAPTRAGATSLGWDQGFGIAKVNPLASWTRTDVMAFAAAHDVPLNPLLSRGYGGVGCTHCTVRSSSERRGRWSGRSKTECGIHTVSSIVEHAPSFQTASSPIRLAPKSPGDPT